MRLSHLTPLSFAILAATSGSVFALDAPNDPSIERVVVNGNHDSGYLNNRTDGATKLDISVKDTPQSITTISAEQLQDFGLTSVNDALERSPGINVDQVETDRTYYTARGFDITNFQVDGLGLPLASGNSHGDMDTAIYQRIEVIHGANGLMTGVGNPSATINMVRKTPSADTQVSLTGTLGSWNFQRLDLDASGSLTDHVRGRVVAVKQQHDSYLDRYSADKSVFYGVVDVDLGENTLLRLGHSQQNNDADGNMWGALTLYYGDGTPTNFARSTNTSADWSTWKINQQHSFVELQHNFNPNWSLRGAYSHSKTDENTLLFYTYLGDTDSGLDPQTGLGLIGYGSAYDYHGKEDNLDLYLSGHFELLGRQHQIVAGVNDARLKYNEVSLYDFHSGKGFPAMPAMEDWDGNAAFPEFTDTGPNYQSDIKETQRAAYITGRFSLSDDVTAIVGARHNSIEVKGSSYGVDQGVDDDKTIPYLGVVYQLNAQLNAYASYTEIFHGQTQLDENFNRLPAVTGKAKEVGIKSSLFNDQALLSVAYFDIQQKDLAVYDKDIINPNTGVNQSVYRAADGIKSQGWEMSLAGDITPGWQASVGYTDFNIYNNQVVRDYTARQLLRINSSYAISQLPGLKVGASYQWQAKTSRNQGVAGSQYDNAGEPIITTQPAYGLLNLMASYQFNAALRLTFNANNVTNKKYLNSLYWAQNYYGAPVNYKLALQWQF